MPPLLRLWVEFYWRCVLLGPPTNCWWASSYLSSDDGSEVKIGEWNEHDESTCQTVVADFFGDPSLGVARHEVGDNAHTAVIETAAQTVLPRHG